MPGFLAWTTLRVLPRDPEAVEWITDIRLDPLRGHLMSWLNILRGVFRRPAPRPPQPPPSPQPTNFSADVAAALLAAHNAARAEAGLQPLTLSPKLVASTSAHAAFMARVGTLAHEGIGDGNLESRLAAVDYIWSFAEENIAEGQADVASVMTAWLSDVPHPQNILSPSVTEMGGAMVPGASGPYWCVDLGRPA